MAAFEHASRATQGARSYQEDTALVWPGADPFVPAGMAAANGEFVAVLADGMGGHVGGALASRTACETFIAAFLEQGGERRDRLVTALDMANAAIAQRVKSNPSLMGMGSTLIGVTFGEEGLQWISVGDSPLFFFRQGELATLNEDHSLAPELDRLAASGAITQEAARKDPRRHMLRSAVTGDELELIDISMRPLKLEAGDYVILASDGLQTLEGEEIQRLVAAYAEDGAAAVASALIRAVEAMRDPHQDNTTVVAVRAL
jgi:protein phosphatase